MGLTHITNKNWIVYINLTFFFKKNNNFYFLENSFLQIKLVFKKIKRHWNMKGFHHFYMLLPFSFNII